MKMVWIIVRKEWEEVLRSAIVLFTMLFTPLIFVVTGVGSVVATQAAGAEVGNSKDADEILKLTGDLCTGLAPSDCIGAYMATLMLLLFMMLPVLLPTVFASYSVVGEKTSRTLEPLLATPITTAELLVGKIVAAVVPAVGATWLGVGVYYAAIAIFAPTLLGAILAPAWLAAVFVLGPLLAVASVDFAVVISSKVTDPRTAQQLSGVVVLPLVLALVGQSLGLFLVNGTLVGIACLACLLLDVALTWMAVELFDREQILTRWK